MYCAWQSWHIDVLSCGHAVKVILLHQLSLCTANAKMLTLHKPLAGVLFRSAGTAGAGKGHVTDQASAASSVSSFLLGL